jgi:hypothetical protein
MSQAMNQAPKLGPKHELMWAWWIVDVPSKRMIEEVCWCRHSQM